MNILCKLGFHKYSQKTIFYPSIHAEIVKECLMLNKCSRCGMEHRWHVVWNGEDMVDYDPSIHQSKIIEQNV